MLRTPTLFMALAMVTVSVTSGCDKKAPKAAKATLTKALDALKNKDYDAFKAQVAPDQREDIVFDKAVTIGGKSHKNWSLQQIVSIQYFATIKDYKVKKSDMWEKKLAHFIVTLDYPDGAFTTTSFFVRKTKDGWKLDMKKMVEHEKESNGANAFSAMKLKKK